MIKRNKISLIVLIVFGIILTSIIFWSIYSVDKKIENNNITNEEIKNELEEDSYNQVIEESKQKNETQKNNTENNIVKEYKFAKPTSEFEERITKKPFGIYIEPSNSPVQPEKFQGYHTGVDVEYEDVVVEVEVYAIANGKVILSEWVSGYGGVVAISHNIKNENIVSLYGHLSPNSLVSLNSKIEKGDKIGILGKGYSSETDGERKHLHLGIIKGSEINLRGYVNNESELSGWYDPVEFLKQTK